jgi:hypothetical protein
VTVEDSTASVYKICIKDFMGNDSWLEIPINGKKSDSIQPKQIQVTDYFLYASQPTDLEEKNVKVSIPKHTFYDDFFIDFDVNNDTLTLHTPTIPAQKRFTIDFDISHYSGEDKDKLYIASVGSYKNKLYYSNTTKKGNLLSTRTKNLGKYTLATDTDKPSIKATNFQDGKWLSKFRYLKLKIKDETSGIKSYRATVNGKWILMEYDYKKGTLTHDFNDNIVTETKYNLKVIVTDNVGNSSTFEVTFFRK